LPSQAAASLAAENPVAVTVPPLPQPAAIPQGTPQEAAAALVSRIRGADDRSALLRAFLAAGIPVIDDAGNAVPGGALGGLAMYQWEFFLAAELGRDDGGLLLSDLGDAIAAVDPSLDPAVVTTNLFEDIKAGTSSTDPSTAAWSWLIVELGRQRDGRDLTLQEPADVGLDWLQVQLILRRLARDFVASANAQASSDDSIVLAVAHPGLGSAGGRYDAPNLPCTFTSTEDRIVTVTEDVESRAVGKVVDYLEEQAVKGAARLALVMSIAGAITDFASFLAAYLALHVDIDLENGPPLVRTDKARPQTGERRTLHATVAYKIGNAQAANCLRLVFSTAGITFSVPPDGPIADARTEWIGLDGFNAATDRIVEFYGGDQTNTRTDAAGMVQQGVEGFGQEEDLKPPLTPVTKQATVRVMVQLKDADPFQDFYDAIGAAVDIAGGPFGYLQLPLEMFYRTRFLKPTDYTFDVKDWELGRLRIEATSTQRTEYGLSADVTLDITLERTGTNEFEGDGVVTTTLDGYLTSHGPCPAGQIDTDVTMIGRIVGGQLVLAISLPPKNYPHDCEDGPKDLVMPGGSGVTNGLLWTLDVDPVSGDAVTGFVFDGAHLAHDCTANSANSGVEGYGAVLTCTWDVDVTVVSPEG
jgi:hypothetical protein